MSERIHTRAGLADDLRRLGVLPGETVMVHAAFSTVGMVVGGPDAFVDALLDVVGERGTILSYQDWELGVDVWDDDGAVRAELRDHVPPFDPATSRAARSHGILASTIGTRRGVRRSGNPGACMAALGFRADELTRDHPLDYGYGEGSPLARLVAVGGQVLMLGAPLDTMTLLHHAEHLADVPGKRTVRIEYPLARPDGGVEWRWIEEFDTSQPVLEGLPDDFFRLIVEDYFGTRSSRTGAVGDATSYLVDASDITRSAVWWIEEWARQRVADAASRGHPA